MLRRIWTHSVDLGGRRVVDIRSLSVFPSLSAWLLALPLFAVGLWYLLSR